MRPVQFRRGPSDRDPAVTPEEILALLRLIARQELVIAALRQQLAEAQSEPPSS